MCQRMLKRKKFMRLATLAADTKQKTDWETKHSRMSALVALRLFIYCCFGKLFRSCWSVGVLSNYNTSAGIVVCDISTILNVERKIEDTTNRKNIAIARRAIVSVVSFFICFRVSTSRFTLRSYIPSYFIFFSTNRLFVFILKLNGILHGLARARFYIFRRFSFVRQPCDDAALCECRCLNSCVLVNV